MTSALPKLGLCALMLALAGGYALTASAGDKMKHKSHPEKMKDMSSSMSSSSMSGMSMDGMAMSSSAMSPDAMKDGMKDNMGDGMSSSSMGGEMGATSASH